jgi:hypothetical protein
LDFLSEMIKFKCGSKGGLTVFIYKFSNHETHLKQMGQIQARTSTSLPSKKVTPRRGKWIRRENR